MAALVLSAVAARSHLRAADRSHEAILGDASLSGSAERCSLRVRRRLEPQTFAGVSCTDSPQPQAPVWFGLLKMNCADILSAL